MIESVFVVLRSIVEIVGIPSLLLLAKTALDAFGEHRAANTYGTAILRAVGEGQLAAERSGYDLFSTAGRRVAVEAGAKYLMNTVPEKAAVLGITTEMDHARRVAAQIGLLQATAQANAAAAPAPAPATAAVVINPPQEEPPGPAIIRPDGSG